MLNLKMRKKAMMEIIDEFTKCDKEDCTGCEEIGKCLGKAIAVIVWLLKDKIDWEEAQHEGFEKLIRKERKKAKEHKDKEIGSLYQ